MKKSGSLRRRWILNTVGVVCALGLACVLAITVVFSAYYYSAMKSDMRYRAENTTNFFTGYINQNYQDYYQSCINYAKSFENRDTLELQFIDVSGQIVATSYGSWAGNPPNTPEIQAAVAKRGIEDYVGRDPNTGEHIIAVSSAMIYSSGEVIGVLRYVSSTRLVDRQITIVALWSLAALGVVLFVVLLSSNYYIHSILAPVAEITEKAKRIAGGSYGIQIQTKYDDEIGELADTINEMSVQINRNEKSQREFISSLSHELRTPLTAITGWSETLLADESLDPDTRRGMKIIQREGKRLTEMVVDLLDFTRIQDGRMTLNMEQADIRGEFEDTVFMYGSRLAQENITLSYLDSDDDIPEIPCDPERMRQVFLNILDNAAKHGGEGKRIDASVRYENGDVVFRIRDYGPGIPEDEIPLVKKKFYKGSSKARGTGIGLAVCDEIVQMHGGTLTLENADGGGTLVTVSLPASQ
ncbi:MAG: HAMP domain-containing sensor histidine kinase [Firmicutes bacterium]|nr:HAMP domain-containing sensor histidine kinase [Bacillota bacterium]